MEAHKFNFPLKMSTDRKYSPNVILDAKGDIVLAPMGKKEIGEANGKYALVAVNNFDEALALLNEAKEGLGATDSRADELLVFKIDDFLNKL